MAETPQRITQWQKPAPLYPGLPREGMMTKVDDGGPAFPTPCDRFGEHSISMSLRDFFAAHALAGICGDGIPGSHHHPEATARDAYDYADAMLRARREGSEQS